MAPELSDPLRQGDDGSIMALGTIQAVVCESTTADNLLLTTRRYDISSHMVWGSTTYGQIFTGSKPWRASFDKSRVSVEVDGKRLISVPIEKMLGMRVEPGVLWATCHFDYQEGGGASLSSSTAFRTHRPPK
jgi:hypothetical protein